MFFPCGAGEPIDGPQNGHAPGPWEIAAQPSQMFQDHVKTFEVPHTASVKPCHGCLGAGMTQCRRCLGAGQVSDQGFIWGMGGGTGEGGGAGEASPLTP